MKVSPFLFEFKEVLIEAFGCVEARSSQSVIGFIKVTETFLRCFVQDANGSHYLKLLLLCGSSSSALVNDDERDSFLFCQKNRVSFSWVEFDGKGIGKMNGLYLEPGWTVLNPFPYNFRRLFSLKLRKYRFGNQDFVEKTRENINEASQDEIVQRGGVRDDNHSL